ncbi:sigma-70 family RNA polymerase sigma factor [Synechococcus sp. 1G10]|uniref:sigma-70 family RNA polymerase sigma factor n=1 Tax=Synechococcus sp. 1G10 TaxID=2025605 RepID=UPI000B985E5F|nr:sigma-70 family RNA polymerase sigma factor [Synechococcus sp. 1G10]
MAHTQSKADALFHQFRPLADSIARRFAFKSQPLIEFEDARQVAHMQLWLSCYQINEAITAPAYHSRCIKGALLHHLRDHGRLVRVSRREHEKGTHPWRHHSLDVTPAGAFTSGLDLLESPESDHQQEEPGTAEIEALLDRLPANQAAVIRLHILVGHSFRQVAAELGISAMSALRQEKAGLATLRCELA